MAYTPDFPYQGEQIIINSGRIFINSRDDSAFINASKAVSLGSGGTLNFDSKDKCIVNSPRIDLGLGARHPVTRGDILKRILERILREMGKAGRQMEKSVDSKKAPIVATNRAGTILKKTRRKVRTEIRNMNSDLTFTV
jgi:hypothetical protein